MEEREVLKEEQANGLRKRRGEKEVVKEGGGLR